MKPQANFDKWVDSFKSELENEKKFSAFYPDCIELIDQYIKKGSLSPPIDKKSDKFVKESIPAFVKLILKFKSLSKEIIDATINFLSKVLSLLTIRVIKGNLDEGKLILDILDSELNLYNRPNVNQFQKLCDLYINNGDYKKLLDRITSDKPDFQHLLLAYRIRKLIKSNVNLPVSELLPVLYKFITHFKDDVSLRTVDTAKFTKIINNEILDKLDEKDTTDYTDLFNLASYLIKTEIFDKQLLGAEILLTYNKKVGKENGTLEKWIRTTDLLKYICKADLHVEIIKRIQPLIKYFSKKHLITTQMIESLFEKAAVTHKSEREPTYELIISAFKGYDNNAIIDFLQAHNPDDLFISILMEKSKEIDIVRYCAITLLKRESKTDLLERLNKNIRQIIIEYINQNFKTQNIKYLQEILPELINTSKDPVKEFDEHVNIIIRDYSGTEDKQEFVLLIYKSYLIKAKNKTSITIEITKQLFQCPNDNLWIFFNDLLKEIGYSLFDSSSYQHIDQYLQNYDYSKVDSEKFVTFMNTYSYKSMEFHRRQVNKDSDSEYEDEIDENFEFLTFPQSFLPILMKAYFTIQSKEDSPIYNQVQNNLLSFYIQLEDKENEIMAKAINISLFPYLNPDNKSNKKSSNLEMERTLSLLIKLINKSEDGIYLEDFGVQRHKEEIMFYPEITLDFKDCKRTIHQDLEVPCSTLIKRIKSFTKNNNAYANYYKLKIYSRSAEIDKTTILSSLHDTNFTVKNFGKIINNKMISIILHEKYQLTNKLISLFNATTIDKKVLDFAWELIQLLPSLKDIKIDLNSCKSEYLLRYSLDLISIDKSFKDYSKLAELLISRKLKHSDIFIMSVILRLFNDEFVPYFPKMCKIILENFKEKTKEDEKSKIIPAQLIQKLSKKYKNSDKIILKYTDDVVTMLFSVTKETIQPIIRTIDPISPLKSIFDKVIERFETIKELENRDWIIKGLFSLYESHSNDVNVKKLIELTMNIADLIQCSTLIQLIHSILQTNPDEKETMKDYVLNTLLDRIFKDDDLQEFESYINLNKYYNKDINNALEKLLSNSDTKCKAFNIKPPTKAENEESNENDNEFRGMINMGVTCFMNSTLQQLFFTFPFRYLVLTTEKDTLLYNIFSELVTPKKEAVQMKKYIPEVDEIIDTHSQQDASEFYQLLIEKQNEQCQSIFKGKFINHCEGINNDYSSVNEEDFTFIALTVIGKKNLHESFESLCEPDIVQIGDNKDANKYQRILKAPQALVIQLKRFELDFNTFRRYKINSVYEFPETFDIGPYMDDKNVGEKIYELFGVVIHSGRANRGHYYSLIKLNGKWYEFNDNYVHEFAEDKFKKVAFGSDKSERNGYLLFYHEKDAVFTDEKNKIRYDQVPDPALENEILNDLNKESPHYCLFTESFLQFANEASLQFQIHYFFNVFLHSTMNSNQSDEFIKKFSNNLKKDDESTKSFTKFAVNEIDSFIGMLIKCKSDDILNSSILVIHSICQSKYSFNFYNGLIQKLDPFIADWSRLSYLSQILLKATPFHLKKAKSNEWNKKIIEFIQKFYKEASTKAKNNINFTDFFKILKLLEVKDISALEDDFKNIIMSPSNSSILTLLDQKQKEKVFSLFENSNSYVSFILESAFPSKKDENDEKEQPDSNVNIDFVVDSIFDHPPSKMKKSDLMKSLLKEIKNRESTSFSNFLIENYSKLILPLFFDQSSDVRSKAESMTYNLFSKSSSIQSSSSSSSSSSDDEGSYVPKQAAVTAHGTTEQFKDFCSKLPDYVNQANKLIVSKYSNKSSMVVSFLRIILWVSNECEIFNLLISIYQVVNNKNKKETNPDSNYIDIISVISKYLAQKNRNYIIQHEDELTPIIYDLFRFGSFESTSKQLFEIMSKFDIDSLINIFKSNEFMNFFKREIKLKKSEETFKKCYNLDDMFENVISSSNEVATNMINFVQNESNLEADHMTITLLMKCKINLVSDQLYLDSINYIIDCALGNADFDLFRLMLETINKTFQSRVKENFDFTKIEEKLINSLTFLRGESAKSKRYYGEMIKNICSKSETITNLILTKLLDIMSNIINDKSKMYRYYILTFQNTVIQTNRFDYFNQFCERIMPLAPVDFWISSDAKPYQFASNNIEKLNDSINVPIKTAIIDHKIKSKDKGLYDLIKNFMENTPIDKLQIIIDEIKENMKSYDKEQLSNIKNNFHVLSKLRPEIKDVVNESSSSSDSSSD